MHPWHTRTTTWTTLGGLLGGLLLGGCGESDAASPSGEQTQPDGQAGAGGPAGGDAQDDEPPTGAGSDDGSDAPPGAPQGVALSPTQHLTRASMALRGVRPSLAELEAVAENPRALEAIVDHYLTTPEFGETVREMHAEALLIDVDPALYPAGFVPRGPLSEMDSQAFNRDLIEAPLRLIEHVVMGDRPFTEVVTADYAMANDTVALVWGMEREDQAASDGWQKASYRDGRPMAGILSDPFLFTRHSSTVSNKGRGRANQTARALLCYDFLEREIPLDSRIDLADPAAVTDAVRNNPACVSCHQTLDPLAAYFSSYRPIYVPSQQPSYPLTFVRPLYSAVLQVSEPSYFGLVGGDIRVLGKMLAQDPRFSACTAQRFYSHMAQVSPAAIPAELLDRLQGTLLDSDMNARALARAIVLSDAFAVSHAPDAGADNADARGVDADALVGLKKVRPQQLARSIEALTGYRWRTRLPVDIGSGTIGTIDLMDDALFGFKVLAGGTDGQHVTRPSHTMTATATLTVENLAERAARHVVAKDYLIQRPERRWLLTEVEPETTEEASIRTQLALLERRLFAAESAPDSAAVDAAYGLFSDALAMADGDTQRAWTVTLYAMFQDPRFLHF